MWKQVGDSNCCHTIWFSPILTQINKYNMIKIELMINFLICACMCFSYSKLRGWSPSPITHIFVTLSLIFHCCFRFSFVFLDWRTFDFIKWILVEEQFLVFVNNFIIFWKIRLCYNLMSHSTVLSYVPACFTLSLIL